ncbi:hypothetical protein D3C80_1633860 [compost metagenome]
MNAVVVKTQNTGIKGGKVDVAVDQRNSGYVIRAVQTLFGMNGLEGRTIEANHSVSVCPDQQITEVILNGTECGRDF